MSDSSLYAPNILDRIVEELTTDFPYVDMIKMTLSYITPAETRQGDIDHSFNFYKNPSNENELEYSENFSGTYLIRSSEEAELEEQNKLFSLKQKEENNEESELERLGSDLGEQAICGPSEADKIDSIVSKIKKNTIIKKSKENQSKSAISLQPAQQTSHHPMPGQRSPGFLSKMQSLVLHGGLSLLN